MNQKLFTSDELKELATPYPLLIQQNIQKKNLKYAIHLCEEMQDSQILLHDFFAESCMVLWSWVGDHLGEDFVDKMFRYIFKHSARRQFFDAARAEAPPHLSVILLAKSWRAHSCFEAGQYPGKFSILEDDEKFTFRLDPCGSGLRLWKKGFYSQQKAGKVSKTKRPWTYNRKGFPYYCIHCPFLNELLPYESQYGSIMWPVDPPSGPDDVCLWYIYKDRNDIPKKYYDRLGISKPNLKKNKYVSEKRKYFSNHDLFEMAQPVTKRIVYCIRSGDLSEAINLSNQVKDEFLVLHDLYVNMLVSTFSFIIQKTGETGFEKALRFQHDACVREQFCEKMESLNTKEQIVFLARRVSGADLCNGSGHHGGRLKIFETEEDVFVMLNPCGSGGRLRRNGAYERQSTLSLLRERIENSLIEIVCRYFKFPEKLFEKMFPMFVNYFTQRKPREQVNVKKSYSWSFEKQGMSSFCCQCGMIQEKYLNKGLTIIPPQYRNGKCVWRISKKIKDLSLSSD